MSVLFYLLIVCSVANYSEAARILAVFPFPSISHQVVFRPLVQELARRGHEVVVITTDPVYPKGEGPANLTEVDVRDISYKIWREKLMATARGSKTDFKPVLRLAMHAVIDIFDAQMKSKEIRQIIEDKNQKFDIILTEVCVRIALSFSHIYKVPVIQVSSLSGLIENFKVVGAPIHPFLYPTPLNQRIHNLTLWEKMTELYLNYYVDRIFSDNEIRENELLREYFGDDAPTIDELYKNVHMLFLNIHPIFEGVRPVPPSVLYIGGIHQKPVHDLPADLKSYLDSSKNGVIYVSFGTNVDPTLLSPEKIQTMVNVLSKLSYDVLWKWNNDELPGRTANIRISKWLPQSDLLKHKNIKLFITQGGLQSTDEAISAGVPLVGIPMMGDQWFNVEKYVHHRIGVGLDFENFSEESLRNAINTVITDNSYRKNIVRLREMMRDEPMKPLDRAVWWTEYVLRHGGAKHLRSPTANMGWAEYLELKLVFALLAMGLVAVVASISAVYLLYIYVFRINFSNPKQKCF